MKILLDTHILIWTLENNPLLPEKARELILNEKNEIYYSCVSTWEVAIKHSLHPDAIEIDEKKFSELCRQSGFTDIPVSNKHVLGLSFLKSSAEANHKDPFDRMLMAQSCTEQMMFLTKDKRLENYELPNVVIL